MPQIGLLNKYKKTLAPTSLSEKREQAYKEIMSYSRNSNILSINLPTGFGKTLSGISLALDIAKEKKMERIIYCLPFLSIIDQTEQVLKSALGLKDSTQFIVHHHLSDFKYTENEREYDFEVSRIFIEGWNSRIILTTFYQLFYTILGYENSYMRRFNKLRRSVVIIDEIQALPHKYWELVKWMIEELVKKLGCVVIFMTATNPFDYPSIVDVNKYRQGLKRYKLILDFKEPMTVEDLAQRVSERIKSTDKTFLFVLNTISSSQKFYRLLKDKIGDLSMTYLSTAVAPVERKKRIEEIRLGKYRVVVSTQVIEAGVDVDFDVIYRDFAPLDSVVQTAGRCNRNNRQITGEVYLIKLEDENREEGKKEYCRRIYSIVLLNATENILKKFGKTEIFEDELLKLVEDYYKELKDKISPDKSNEIIEYVEKLEYKWIKEKFKLIEEEPYKDLVFIELDETAENTIKELKDYYEKLKRKDINLWEFRKFFHNIKSTFYQYVINVSTHKNKPPVDDKLKIFLVKRDFIQQYYDAETGYKIEEEELIW